MLMKGASQLSDDALQFCDILSGDGLCNQGLNAVFEATLWHWRNHTNITADSREPYIRCPL